MGMQEDRVKALTYCHPEFIPVGIGILPSAWMKYREELDEITARFPSIFGPRGESDRDYDAVGGTYVAGEHVDVWGCVWSNVHTGSESIVTGHAVPTRQDVHHLRLPEKLDGFPHGFMFLRLADLRGFSEVMMDFAEEPPELQMLIDVVLEHNLRQVDKAVGSMKDADIAFFGDDLGMQHSLPMHPDAWRKYLKPCFQKIYAPFKAAGLHIYMHTDGHITEIIPDLKDCGVDVVNPQIRANGLDRLVEVCKGKICVDLDLDRQLFPFCRPEDIDPHVEEAVRKLGAPEGGLWLKAEVAEDVPIETIEAICVALDKYRGYFRSVA